MTDGRDRFGGDMGNTDGEAPLVRSGLDQFDRPSTGVVEAIAAVTDQEPQDVPPLYDVVDPDALDAIVSTDGNDTGRSVRVSFAYEGLEVTVDSASGIEVRTASAEGP